MPSIDVDFEVYCSKCGSGICRNTDVDQSRGGVTLTVEPCEKCLEEAKDEGIEEGSNKEN